jgi:hypothetical protein
MPLRAYLLNRQRLGELEILSLPKDPSTPDIHAPHWILASQISTAQLNELTSHRAAIATVSYMPLFLVIGLISLSFARTAFQKNLLIAGFRSER